MGGFDLIFQYKGIAFFLDNFADFGDLGKSPPRPPVASPLTLIGMLINEMSKELWELLEFTKEK